MSYTAPLKDMLFVIDALAGLDAVAAMPGFEDATRDTAQAVLEENAQFVQDVVAPLNRAGDVAPSSWKDGVVTTSRGFKEAFRQYAEAGWQGVQHDVEFGGQGLPKLIATPCIEMLNAANLSFALCPLLTDGAIEALMTAGSDAQKATYLDKLIAGRWTGTMNLTEPQAGSDLAQVRTRAVPQGDGTLPPVRPEDLHHVRRARHGREHRPSRARAHARRARRRQGHLAVHGAEVPRRTRTARSARATTCTARRSSTSSASRRARRRCCCSATATSRSTARPGAIGELVGEENRGLEYMFVMMNAARFQVGMQGIAIAERAYQQAVAYAKDRVQSRDVAGSSGPVTIIHHPDVRRMLMSMRAQVEAARALAYVTAAAYDAAHRHPDADARARTRRSTSSSCRS